MKRAQLVEFDGRGLLHCQLTLERYLPGFDPGLTALDTSRDGRGISPRSSMGQQPWTRRLNQPPPLRQRMLDDMRMLALADILAQQFNYQGKQLTRLKLVVGDKAYDVDPL